MKKIIAILVVLLLFIQYRVWLGDGGIPEILELQKEVDAAQTEINRLKERNKALEAEVNDLKVGLDAIEERARSDMGMIGEGEVYYQVIENKTANKSVTSTDQAKKSESASVNPKNNQK